MTVWIYAVIILCLLCLVIWANAILDKWSKMAYDNKAFLITDFQDLESPDDVIDIFFNADHTSGDAFKSNTVMTCNWLLGRAKEDSVGEEENLYVPPSTALAGKRNLEDSMKLKVFVLT